MKKVIAAAGIGAALTVGTLLGAGTASANTIDENAYLNALNNAGFNIYNSAQAISTGYHICSSLGYEDGNAVARELYHSTSYSDVPSLHVGMVWVQTAASTLCPWVWSNAPIVPALY